MGDEAAVIATVDKAIAHYNALRTCAQQAREEYEWVDATLPKDRISSPHIATKIRSEYYERARRAEKDRDAWQYENPHLAQLIARSERPG